MEKAAPLMVEPLGGAAATIGNEDVHDFRVALRRLRSWMRATRDLLDPVVPPAQRAALRRLAQRAGGARDAQVQWAWFTAPALPFTAGAARAAAWFAAQQHASYLTEHASLQRRLRERWPDLAQRVAAALEAPGPAADAPAESLAEHLESVLARHLQIARRALDRIEHRSQVNAIHRARIKVKRLRYLVEAIDPHTRAGLRAVRHLRALQDALGELHDAHVMDAALAPFCAPARRRRRSTPRPALRDLRSLRAAVRRRELAAFRRSMDLAGADDVAAFWRDPARSARTLLSPSATRHVASVAPGTTPTP